MANELGVTYTGSNSVYAILRRLSDNYVWNGTGFEAWVNANITTYDITLTSSGGDLYVGNFPNVTTGIRYRVIYYEEAVSATPAITDLLLATKEGYWDGTTFLDFLSSTVSSTSTNTFGSQSLLYATVDDVIAILPRNITRVLNMRNRQSEPNIDEDMIEDYIRRAESVIDATLEHIYVVPLQRIKQVDNRTQAQTTSYVYPDPIPFVAQRLAASYIYNERFTGDGGHIDGSVYGDRYDKEGMNELNRIIIGSINLIGQKHKGWRYGRPESRNINITPQFADRISKGINQSIGRS